MRSTFNEGLGTYYILGGQSEVKGVEHDEHQPTVNTSNKLTPHNITECGWEGSHHAPMIV